MSQVTDYNVDNSTGANVRADINAILDAIRTNNSGGSDNGSVGALGFFANTSSSKLQLKNAAGNAFINLRGFDGTLPLPDGSAASPSLFFDDDTDTGIFSGGANQFQITTGGAQRLKLDGTEVVFNDNGTNTDFRIEGDTDSNLFFVDAGNDRVGIGTISPSTLFHCNLAAENGSIAQFGLSGQTNNQSFIIKADDSDSLFTFRFGSSNSTYPAVRFNMGADQEAMRITSGGNIGIGLTNPGQQLDVSGIVRVGSYFQAGASGTGANNFHFGAEGDGRFRLFRGNYGSGSAEPLTIDASNNLGISTVTPAAKVHITGSELRLQNSSVPFIRLKSTNAQGSNNADYGRIISEGGGVVHGILDWKRQGATDDAYFTVFTKQSVTDIQERIRLTSKGAFFVHAGQQTNLNNMNKDSFSMPKFFENTSSQDNSLVGGDMHFETIIRGTNASSDTLFTFEGGGNCGFFCEITAYFSSAISDFQGRQRMWWRATRTGSGNFSLTQAHNYDKVGTATNVYFNPLWTSSGSGANQVLGVKVNSTNMGAYVRFWFVARIIAHDSINSMTINR